MNQLARRGQRRLSDDMGERGFPATVETGLVDVTEPLRGHRMGDQTRPAIGEAVLDTAALLGRELRSDAEEQALWLGTGAMVRSSQPASSTVGLDRPKVAELSEELMGALLEEALEELRNVENEAAEDGYPIPSEVATSNAEKTLKRLFRNYPARYTICPTEEGDIAISVPVAGIGRAMTIECDSDGGLICFVNVDGHMRRMKDYDADMAWESSDFIVRALGDLRE